MHPEDIKAALRKEHRTVTAFERKMALPAGSVRDVLRGRSVRRTAQAIVDCLGKPIEKVFPGRFVTSPDNTSQKRDAHGLSAGSR